jgi:hypothetical protein
MALVRPAQRLDGGRRRGFRYIRKKAPKSQFHETSPLGTPAAKPAHHIEAKEVAYEQGGGGQNCLSKHSMAKVSSSG